MMEFVIRQLSGHAEYLACFELQKETWGRTFSECVPPSILMVCQKIGGVAAGAFDKDGTLAGFVFGISGVKDGKLVHWSDMLAVKTEHRGKGLGRALKLFQRDYLLGHGIEIIYWTYDPLEARNAHLNLNRLGVEIDEYVQDMYPSEDSKLHRGLGMDRFIVAWHIRSKHVSQAIAGKYSPDLRNIHQYPIINSKMSEGNQLQPIQTAEDLPLEPGVRVEVPANIQQVKSQSEAMGRKWRLSTRQAFLGYFQHGYSVDSFYRDAKTSRCFYILTQKGSKAHADNRSNRTTRNSSASEGTFSNFIRGRAKS